MDYLDPRKQSRNRIVMLVGYIFITIAILLGTRILVYSAYGYGLGKNGAVVQSGLVFISSQPNPASIYLNGKLNSSTTNTRLLLQSGLYQLRLTRPGYRDWRRTIGVDGGLVEHFDYPLLIPTKLTTSKLQTYTSAPSLETQSPDRRWLLVQPAASDTTFDLYDLNNPKKITPTTISLPSGVASQATSSESWQLVDWADDNQHILLEHIFDGRTEFILLDRQNPDQSVNLNATLNANPTMLTLNNKKYNQYYLYDSTSDVLQTATLSSPTPTPILTHVLAFQSYGNNSVLYATDSDAPAGKVLVKLAVGNQTYVVHAFPAGGSYLLDLTQYAGTLYVVAGDGAENKIYIYKDPVAQLSANPSQAVVPTQVLHVNDPNYLSFSDNAQFIVAENGPQFGVYDILNKNGYNYISHLPLDAPQTHATWMDGDRLTYVSGGKLVIFDYDDTNAQTLVPLSSNYLPYFSSDYHYVYGLAPGATAGQLDLTQTPLLLPADL
jgi:hypothetical protein